MLRSWTGVAATLLGAGCLSTPGPVLDDGGGRPIDATPAPFDAAAGGDGPTATSSDAQLGCTYVNDFVVPADLDFWAGADSGGCTSGIVDGALVMAARSWGSCARSLALPTELEGLSVATALRKPPDPGTMEMTFAIAIGADKFSIHTDGVTVGVRRVTPDGVSNLGSTDLATRWAWRVRGQSGTLLFEISSDGVAWSLLASAKPATLTVTKVSLGAVLVQPLSAACGFEDVRVCPP